MEIKEVYYNLCYKDLRNPNHYWSWEKEIEADELEPAGVNCYCDNCIYGRDKLALEIIKLNKLIK